MTYSITYAFFNTINKESRKMVTNIMFAKQHKNKQNLRSSFEDTEKWKKYNTR